MAMLNYQRVFFSGQIGPETHPWTALFPAAALAPTLSWAALGTKCLGTREDGRGLRESLPDTTIFLGEKHGKNAEKTWYMHGLRQIFPWVFPVT